MDRRLEALAEASTVLLQRLESQKSLKLILYMPAIRRARASTEGTSLFAFFTIIELVNSVERKAFDGLVLEKNLQLFMERVEKLKVSAKPLYNAVSSRTMSETYVRCYSLSHIRDKIGCVITALHGIHDCCVGLLFIVEQLTIEALAFRIKNLFQTVK
jgi:hypothetical protein